jgi:hypothetical protein
MLLVNFKYVIKNIWSHAFYSPNFTMFTTCQNQKQNVYSVNTYIFTQDNPWKLESLFPVGSCIMHGSFALGGHCGRKPEHPEKTHVSEWATNHTFHIQPLPITGSNSGSIGEKPVRSHCATRTPNRAQNAEPIKCHSFNALHFKYFDPLSFFIKNITMFWSANDYLFDYFIIKNNYWPMKSFRLF